MNHTQSSFWQIHWKKFCRNRLAVAALYILAAFVFAAVYAPLLASSKPLFVLYEGQPYFPLARYLFYSMFFTKALDLFFNLVMFTLPLGLVLWRIFRFRPKIQKISLIAVCLLQIALFAIVTMRAPIDPASDISLTEKRMKFAQEGSLPNWQNELEHMSPYAKLNLLLRYRQRVQQYQKIRRYVNASDATPQQKKAAIAATLWQIENDHENREIANQRQLLSNDSKNVYAKAKISYLEQRRHWLEAGQSDLHYLVMPLLRPYHWEDDAGGNQGLNRFVPWWELTRLNQKDLLAALIFGTRISLVVGILSVAIALIIAVPFGAFAGYYGGRFDIVVSRLLEVWESMPTFFMLLMVVAITGSKSVFLVIAIIGLFGWTSFSRYIRGEFFKQRHLPYVEACKALGYSNSYTMFVHILPNAIPPVLTLLPFAIMAAITSEAGLSFLGLGEEGSCSWGVLMDEGRNAFPAESYLMWPPALLLSLLLIVIAIVGDGMRDALDPRH